jgi:CRISPR-associated protein Cmr5
MLTRDQRYAVKAYEHVSAVKKDDQKSYGAMAHKLPILIRTAGLAQALTFVEARGLESQKQLLKDLASTLGKASEGVLLEQARSSELSAYMLLTQQVLAALLWYKRFAQSVLGVQASDEAQSAQDGKKED